MPTAELLWPYLNKSLQDMPGEVWKDIPGFEGSYQASNLGRVKSLDRIIPHPRIKQQFGKGKILSQRVNSNRNLKTGEPMIDLGLSLAIEGIIYYCNTRRIIYKTFIDRHLEYKENGPYVINMDGDGFNNKPENLRLVTHSEKQKRAVVRGRILPSLLRTADMTNWKKSYSRCKPVEQYDLDGNLIKRYRGIREVARQTQVEVKVIIQVAKGIYKQWNGFVWKYA